MSLRRRSHCIHEYSYILKDAALCYGEEKFEPVLACSVPYPHESKEGGTLRDICCNILGVEVYTLKLSRSDSI